MAAPPVALADLADPTDLDALRSALSALDPAGALVPLGLQRLVVADDAAEQVVPALAQLLAARGGDLATARVVLVVDATPVLRRGRDLKDDVEAALAAATTGAGGGVERVVLRDAHAAATGEPSHEDGDPLPSSLHADEAALATAAAAVAGADAVVTVGGGTITDIGKVATSRTGGAPLVVVQTAASVDGFTDNVSVVLASGVKKTIDSRWPDVVLADLPTIAGAPPAMAAAGYGELLSMFTAPADWYLAGLVGTDETFHRAPVDLLGVVGRGLDEWSPGVGRAEPDAVAALTRALDVRGVATGVSGGTAVLSGVEHLVSHMLDMHHGALGRPIGLHGAQVGVASVVASAAWTLLLDRLGGGGAARVDPASLARDPAALRQRSLAAFAHLDPSGALGAECWRRYEGKVAAVAARPERLADLLARWDEHAEVLRSLLVPAPQLLAGLRAAGVPASFAALEPSVPADLARWAVAHCHLMRERLTAVDLLDALGWWGPQEVATVLGALDGPDGSAA